MFGCRFLAALQNGDYRGSMVCIADLITSWPTVRLEVD